MNRSVSIAKHLIVLTLATVFLTNSMAFGVHAVGRPFKEKMRPAFPASTPSAPSFSRPVIQTTATAEATYGKVPLSFEANLGQVDGAVKFLARGSGYDLFLTSTEAVFALTTAARSTGKKTAPETPGVPGLSHRTTTSVLRMRFAGANPSPQVEGLNQLAGKVNYLRGRDQKRWQAQVPTYAGVEYKNVYSGVDAVYYGNQQQLEYDFRLAPGADPHVIQLAFEGARKIRVDKSGDLILSTDAGDVRERKPFAYQEENGAKQPVAVRFVVKSKNEVGFEVGQYDQSKPLVIDPALVYSTYLGGAGNDFGSDITLDSQATHMSWEKLHPSTSRLRPASHSQLMAAATTMSSSRS